MKNQCQLETKFCKGCKMLTRQDFKCAICRIQQEDAPKEVLCVDHCHTKNKVRQLLCIPCNTALGGFKDNIDILKQAIKYLEEN